MAKQSPKSRKLLSDSALVERIQSIFINAAEGRRSVGDDREYPELTKEVRRRKLEQPTLVKTHPSVDSFVAAIKGTADQRERVQRIRDDFGWLLMSLASRKQGGADAAAWTGPIDRVSRLKVVRQLLPQARDTVEMLIAALSEPGPNGGPLLDEQEEVIRRLRELHGTLGELLNAIDGGRFDDDLGQGLVAETVRLAKTVRDNLVDEPLPCAIAGLLLGIFTLGGHPTAGAFLSDATYRFATRKSRAG
jgi:hypothetical protein